MEQKKFEPYVFHSPVSASKQGVRVTVVGEILDGKLNVAVARCGIEDKFKFTKKEGRERAMGRLNAGDYATSVPCESPNLAKFIEVAKTVSELVIKHSTYKKITLEETVKTIYSYKAV